MSGLEFVFGISVLFFLLITIIGVTSMKYDTKKLEEENKALMEQLKKARKRRAKKEYEECKCGREEK